MGAAAGRSALLVALLLLVLRGRGGPAPAPPPGHPAGAPWWWIPLSVLALGVIAGWAGVVLGVVATGLVRVWRWSDDSLAWLAGLMVGAAGVYYSFRGWGGAYGWAVTASCLTTWLAGRGGPGGGRGRASHVAQAHGGPLDQPVEQLGRRRVRAGERETCGPWTPRRSRRGSPT